MTMNHLHELISLVKHPAIQGRRGEWKTGDRFYDQHKGPGIYIDGYLHGTGETPHNLATDDNLYWLSYTDGLIWIPKLSDPIQPERGLLGLLEGNWTISNSPDIINDYAVLFHDFAGEIIDAYYGPTPEIAVAKAIVSQNSDENFIKG